MAVRNVAFESAACKYMELTEDEAIKMITEENEKAWKDRQAEIKYAREEIRTEGERNCNIEISGIWI